MGSTVAKVTLYAYRHLQLFNQKYVCCLFLSFWNPLDGQISLVLSTLSLYPCSLKGYTFMFENTYIVGSRGASQLGGTF